MVPTPTNATAQKTAVSPRHALLESLLAITTEHVNAQLMPMSLRFAAALIDQTEMAEQGRTVYQRIRAGNLLKANGYAFFHLAAAAVERALRLEIVQLAPAPRQERRATDLPLSLVPYEEMDSKVVFSGVGRAFEQQYAKALAALNVRLASLFGRDSLRAEQNPFRPELFLLAVDQAWREFEPDAESQGLILPLLRPNLFLDLGPMFDALNLALMSGGVLPGSIDAYCIRKTDCKAVAGPVADTKQQAVLAQQLRQFFSGNESAGVTQFQARLGASMAPAPVETFDAARNFPHGAADQQGFASAPAQGGGKHPLLAYLENLHPPGSGRAASAGLRAVDQAISLSNLKQRVPQGSLTRHDERTIDLLATIFETVFHDQSIAQEIRDLISFLQVPVLKTALLDKDFFFQQEHPARRLIDLMSRMGWEQRNGPDDPVFRTMQRSVDRVGRDGDQALSVFSEAVAELEASIEAEENAAAGAMAAPIARALEQEKTALAGKSAKSAVALRLGSGEVVALVDAFLEDKWTCVLTLAYSLEDEKPGAVNSATTTMDQLIWSVKPKVTQEQRKQLISKLPSLLSMLNKWLDIIKWQDADRLQFFAELAECHASIVRAPLELSPERQLEIAIEVAQLAAQRRLELAAAPAPAVVADDDALTLMATLQRGWWFEFSAPDALTSVSKVKLAWISPLRTLFIFSNGARQPAFSLDGEKLAQALRDKQVRLIRLDDVVGQALSQAMAGAAVNDDAIDSRQTAGAQVN